MLKRLLQLLFIGILPIVLFSQTSEEKSIITKDYNTEFLNDLAKSFHSQAESEKAEALKLAKQKGWPVIIEKDGKFSELMKVSKEGTPVYYSTFNVNAARSTRAHTLHNGGILGLNLEGQNMEAHVWDAGLARTAHQEYDGPGGTNRFSIGDGTSTLHWHSAHVAGTIIAYGAQSSAKGMAPQADAVGYDWDYDISEATSAANNGMLLSNHSYGWDIIYVSDWEFGAYVSESRSWDIVMYNAPYYLMVVSAGNDGNDNSSNGNPLDGNSAYDKLYGHATSKNNLVVANAQDASINGNGDLISVSINSGSSEGPCDDYRIKPDITGNGTSLYSTLESNNSDYGYLTGTSMSSPNVCGTLLLVQQHYNNQNSNYMRAATLKGLALHTADDAGPSGPDAIWGWGLLNGKEAANVITNDGVESRINELTLSNGNTYTTNILSDGTNDLIASICWTDPAGSANNGTPNDPDPALVNDLDIRVTQGGSTYYPYRLTSITTNGTGDNDVDPFEKVIISGASGTYTVSVSHKGNLSSGSQAFSLILSGLSGNIAPEADFEADILAPSVGQTVNFTDLSINTPSSWLWTFIPSSVTYVGGTSSSSQNPQVQFNSTGFYTVQLVASNAYGNDTETKSNYIDVSFFCDASGAADYLHISSVQLGTINNPSGQDYYADYTYLSTDLIPGETGVQITVINGEVYGSEDLGIWIDWNQDGDFYDSGENIVCEIDGDGQGTFTFNVPLTATLGTTRMRVRIKYVGSDCGDPCGTTTYGEVEDYSINIVAVTPGLWTGTVSNNWNVTSNWDDNNIPGSGTDVLIPSAPSGGNFPETNSGPDAICNNLTIEGGAHLFIPSNNTLTVNGTLTNNSGVNGLRIKSDINGTGSLIHETPAINATIERYLTDMKWHFLGMPVESEVAGVFHLPGGHSDIYLRTHIESTNTWDDYIVPVSTPLDLGRGYECWVGNPYGFTQDETIIFNGILNTGDYTTGQNNFYDLEFTQGHGLNLLSNPYPSALLADITTWPRASIASSVWTWDDAIGNYRYWNGSGNPTGYGTLTGGIIPAMQGFFVLANRGNPVPTLTIPQSSRVHSNQAFYKSSGILNTLRLDIEGNGYSDAIFISFNDLATEEFDPEYDVKKLFGLAEAPQLYATITDEKLSINSIAQNDNYRIVNVGFESSVEKSFIFEASGMESFGTGYSIYLEDIKEGLIQKVSDDPVYSFAHHPDNDPNRFIIHFGSPNSVNESDKYQPRIYSYHDVVYIQTAEYHKGEINIYDMIGQEIISGYKVDEELSRIRITNKPGYYIVEFKNDEVHKSEKVFIR